MGAKIRSAESYADFVDFIENSKNICYNKEKAAKEVVNYEDNHYWKELYAERQAQGNH